MKLKSYPDCFDSGVEWAEEIPNHWEIKRIKNLFRVVNGSTPNANDENWDGDIIWITPEDLGKLKEVYISSSSRKITYKGFQTSGTNLIPKNSIIISSRAPIGHIGIAGVELSTNQGCKSLVPLIELDIKYFYYLLKSIKIILQSQGQGATFTELSGSNLKSIQILDPSLLEQIKITEFLDNKTKEIDFTIEKDTRLIELLKEKKTALINRVVNKGLNPEAKMKDSGVEWIREIPGEWDLRKLKYITTISSEKRNKKPDKLPYIGLENIKSWTGVLIDDQKEEIESSVSLFNKGDILFGKLRPYLAKVIVAPFDGACTTELVVLKVNKNINNRFIFYHLLSHRFINIINSLTYGAKMPRANVHQIGNMILSVPSLKEQTKLVKYLDDENSQIDLVIEKIEKNIKFLNEYKKSLIHHVVTGKVDVRELAV